MVDNNKSWSLSVFSSARVLSSYTTDQLVALGISWVWMGLEGQGSEYAKLKGIDTRAFVRTLQSHGIRVLGSTIIGLEEHTPENIDVAIDYAVGHDTEFHQFMLYTPIPGTPLHTQHRAAGTLLDRSEISEADTHGQYRFNYRHQHIKPGQETEFLLRAFRRDFEVNGPSIIRVVRTILRGWKRYKNHPDQRIRGRFAWEARHLPVIYAGALKAARHWFRSNRRLSTKFSRTLRDIYREFGFISRLGAPIAGWYIRYMLRREDRRLRRGWTYEPSCSRLVKKATILPAQSVVHPWDDSPDWSRLPVPQSWIRRLLGLSPRPA
jgi:hypothetical protein